MSNVNLLSEWISDRPLDINKDSQIWISRKDEVQLILKLLFSSGCEGVFIWSPPKSGTTTFLNEVVHEASNNPTLPVLLNVNNGFDLNSYVIEKESLLIVDELEDLISIDQINCAINLIEKCKLNNTKVIVTGDSRVYEYIRNSSILDCYEETNLKSPNEGYVAQKLIIDMFKRIELDIQLKDAQTIFRESGGNLFLIQCFCEALYSNPRFWRAGSIVEGTIGAVISNAGDYFKEYFNDLKARVVRDTNAPYAMIDLLSNKLKDRSDALRGIGIVNVEGLRFSSPLHERICKQDFIPRKMAQRFGLEGNWEKASEFYDNHLNYFCQKESEKISTLEDACYTAYVSRDVLKYTSYSHQLSRIMTVREDRLIMIKEKYTAQLIELLSYESEKNYSRIFDAIIEGVDTIARTGRARLYLTDASDKRLMCRAVLGVYADEIKREPIPIESDDWKVTKVYKKREFEELTNTGIDKEVNQNISKMLQVSSVWFFPLFTDCESYRDANIKGNCIGVLCVDNPYHSPDRPTDGEKGLIYDLLTLAYPFLLNARKESNRYDLQFRIDKLLSLHKHILTTDPSEEVLEHLFKVGFDLQTNLSAIVVRMVKGYSNNRLQAVKWWPKELSKIFSKPELAIISRDSSKISEILKDQKTVIDGRTTPLEVFDVNDPAKYKEGSALDIFIKSINEERMTLQLGSLLMYSLETETEYLGTCSFYTQTPRKFLEDEKESLSMIVNQAAVALYNAQRIEETNRQRKGIEILNSCIAMTNQRLHESDPLREIKPIDLQLYLAERLGNLFNVHSATFVTPDYKNNRMIVDCTWPKEKMLHESDSLLKFTFGIDRGVTSQVIRTGEPHVLSIKDPDWEKEYVEVVGNIQTCAAIPMKDGENIIIGAFALESIKEDAFTAQDIKIIEAVVSQVPIAIRNAELMMNYRNSNLELTNTKSELEEINIKLKESFWMEAMGESVGAVVHRMSHYASPIKAAADIAIRYLDRANNKEHIATAIEKLKELQIYGQELQNFIQKFNQANASIDKERFTLDIMIKELAKAAANINVNIDIADNFEIITDKFKLQLILECLIDNAFNAVVYATAIDNSRMANVKISVNLNETNYQIDIADNGLGIPIELQEKLLKHIVQSQNKDGNGSGLFISQRLATRLNGAITFKSDINGSIFTLTIPAVLSEGENQ